jgi:hypothetical protein
LFPKQQQQREPPFTVFPQSNVTGAAPFRLWLWGINRAAEVFDPRRVYSLNKGLQQG